MTPIQKISSAYRQAVTTDKERLIDSAANLPATETIGDARYPLDLFLRVITVSLETMKMVNGLPSWRLIEGHRGTRTRGGGKIGMNQNHE